MHNSTSCTLDIIYKSYNINHLGVNHVQKQATAERNANSISRPQEILGKRGDGPAIADGNGSVVAMGIVVRRLLVVLQLCKLLLARGDSNLCSLLTRFMRGSKSNLGGQWVMTNEDDESEPLAVQPGVLKSSV